MKKTLLSLLCLGFGFLSARWIPGPAQSLAAAAPSPSTVDASGKALLSKKPARSLDLTGDWKSSAEAWAKEDPAAFRDWLVQNGEPPGDEVLKTLFLEWVKRGPDAAIEAALNLPADFNRQDYLLVILLNGAIKGSAGLATVLKWAPLVEEQISGWSWPGDDWLKKTPPEVLAAQFKNSNAEKKLSGYSASLLTRLGKYWALSDFPAALEWMKSLGPNSHRAAIYGIMDTWTEKDPQAALAFLATEASSEERWNAHIPLAKLAETDPRAAMDWWEENRGIPDPNCVSHIFGNWCATNAEEARDYALSMEDPVLRRHCLESWSASAKSAQLLDAVNSSSDPDTRTVLLKALTSSSWAEPERLDIVMDLVKNQTYPEITPEMASGIARSIVNPAKALEWASSLPESFQEKSVQAAVSRWMQEDKIAAAQSVQNLPDGPAKTVALQILAPPSAKASSTRFPDPD